MITSNARIKDPEDVGLLFHSILRYGEANADRLDTSILSIGYAKLLQHADEAAQHLAAVRRGQLGEFAEAIEFTVEVQP